MSERIQVELHGLALEELSAIANARGIDLHEAVIQGIYVLKLMTEEEQAGNYLAQVDTKTQTVKRVIIAPMKAH